MRYLSKSHFNIIIPSMKLVPCLIRFIIFLHVT